MTGRGGPDSDRRNDIVLTTERLTLDLPIPDDAATLFGLVGGDERHQVCQYLIWDGPDFVADIAEWIGTTRESTARALARFRSAGAIETGRGHIRVHDPAALAALVESA